MSHTFQLQKNGTSKVFGDQAGSSAPPTTSLATNLGALTAATSVSVGVSAVFGTFIAGNVAATLNTQLSPMTTMAGATAFIPTNSTWTPVSRAQTVWRS